MTPDEPAATPDAPDDSFVGDVLSRTSGPACARARLVLGGAVDDPLDAPDRVLLDGHLAHCAECRAVADVLPVLRAELPALATLEPDSGFTARVLAATSGQAGRASWPERWTAWWADVSARPRIAWEVAYALTVVLVLLVGDPVRAWDAAAARVQAWPAPTLDVRLPQPPPTVAAAGGRVVSRLEAAYAWLEKRSEATTVLLSALRGEQTARSSLWYAMTDAANRWVRVALSWARPVVRALSPAPTEPTGDPVRSGNQTDRRR
jgi:hypothetical protein